MITGAAFRILACYFEGDTRSFVELCERAGYPTDLGGYYIRQLVQSGYLQKSDRGQYTILPKGKQELAFNYGRQLLAPRPRFVALLVAKQGEKFLTLQRTVQPYIGATEWPAGVIHAGESATDAAARIAQERFGCSTQPQPAGFFRRIDFYDNKVFDDKLFAVHTVTLPKTAAVAATTSTGTIIPYTESELLAVRHPAKSLLDIFHYTKAGSQHLAEHSYTIEATDFSS